MLNYSNLNDVEFEDLCQDIMSKKLDRSLRRYAAGRDGGIDLSDTAVSPDIIVQVKYYQKTDAAGLIASLKKEIEKVEALKPKQYYICCSKELSPTRIKEIYRMFSAYMDSDKNIITLIEIDNFLSMCENAEILQRHYKLWISSSNILQDIYSNDIFIDCESLLSSIEKVEKFFVETTAYSQALKCLAAHKTLFLTGDPGVGKTITSKMLILYFAAKGYRVRYTTDVTDLAALKRAISKDRNTKEVILLDDCLGQAYFEMKTSQGTELLSLIRFVNASKSKLLILNSRVTIYQEACLKTPELVKSFENKEFKIQILDMNVMPDLEKARILYNHMYFSTEDEDYFYAIKENRNYMNIINHDNYNPRIIEFISDPNRYKGITTANYYEFILNCLDNPHMVWDNEYEERLQVTDRSLLITLFSLSNTEVSYELVKKCFMKRIQRAPGIDTTINQFERSLKRLQDSFIRIIDQCGSKKISMVNPSVNDYLRSKLKDNPLELEIMLESALVISQYKRLLPDEEAEKRIISQIETGDINKFYFENEVRKCGIITSYVASNCILNLTYKKDIYLYLKHFDDIADFDKTIIHAADILVKLFGETLFHFYEIDTFLKDFEIFKEIILKLELIDLVNVLGACYEYFEEEFEFIEMCEEVVQKAVDNYCESIEALSYDSEIGDIVSNYTQAAEYGYEIDKDRIFSIVESKITSIVEDQIYDIVGNLPGDLSGGGYLVDDFNIYIGGIEEMIDFFLDEDYDDEGYNSGESNSNGDIDLIFNR